MSIQELADRLAALQAGPGADDSRSCSSHDPWQEQQPGQPTTPGTMKANLLATKVLALARKHGAGMKAIPVPATPTSPATTSPATSVPFSPAAEPGPPCFHRLLQKTSPAEASRLVRKMRMSGYMSIASSRAWSYLFTLLLLLLLLLLSWWLSL